MEPVTKSFLGSRDAWRNARIELNDIHDVWGGKCITVYGDGTAFVKIVDLARSVETYRMQLAEERVPELFETLLQHDVLALDQATRAAGEDEICTRLTLTNAAGATQSICYWESNEADQRFEAVRNTLAHLHDHMAELGARLVAAIAAPPTGFELFPGDDADAANNSSAFDAVPANPTVSLGSDAAGGDARAPLRALQAVAAFFTEDGWSFEQMPERPILRLPFQGKGGRWNCYAQIRVTRDVEQILFYSVLPLNVPADKLSAIAEFITRANYGMALGNFELDFNDGEVRYKTSLDVTAAEITGNLLRPLIYTNVLMMDKYMAGLMAVVYADMSPAEAVRNIEGG